MSDQVLHDALRAHWRKNFMHFHMICGVPGPLPRVVSLLDEYIGILEAAGLDELAKDAIQTQAEVLELIRGR